MTKQTHCRGWILAALLTVLGIAIWLFPAYRFSAYLTFGLALTVVAFQLLRLLGRYRQRTAKILKTMLIIFLCILLVAGSVTGFLIAKSSQGSSDDACFYLIVLGAGVNGTEPSLSLLDRLTAAKAYLDTHPETICVVTGGQGPGEQISEAACMANWLTEHGIAEERIILEEQATSTQENLSYSLALIQERTGTRPERAAIISSEYHLFRAGLMAKKEGLNPIGVPAATHRTSLKINYFLREIVAVWYYLIFGG